jgi:hypothetical protein
MFSHYSMYEGGFGLLIYLKPEIRQRIVLFLSLALVVLGARAGVLVSDKGAAAKITPLTRVNTVDPNIGVVVEVFQAKPELVEECIDVLESTGIKATWFLSATFSEAYSTLINKIVDKGHELGLSGTDDRFMDRLSPEEIKDRLTRARETILKLGTEPMPFFYAPSGRFNDELINTSFHQGFYSVKGSIDGKVLKGKAERVIPKVGGSIKPGDILVIHIGKKGIVPRSEYIESLATYLNSQGIFMVSLSALVRGVR